MKLRLSLAALLCSTVLMHAEHPQLLVTRSEHDAIKNKVETAPWARAAFEKMKAEVDKYVALTEADPQWMTSRLAMNWTTHHATPVTSRSRLIGGEGYAPVPTPRFAGARDWASKYSAPDSIEKLRPFNDNKEGKIRLLNNETKQEELVAPSQTGRIIEGINQRIMNLAANAGFLYWITGEEKYARFASDILWTYMEGFSHVTAPKIDPPDQGSARIIGMTSFEVIHEDIVTPLSVSYDFLYDYLKKQGRDAALIQNGLKRMIDRVIDGGGREGNWNLNQARIIAYGGLALEDNASYQDKKGRPYYVDIILHADLPNQRGIAHVIDESIDPETALWPEAPGYGFGTAKDILLIATLVGSDPAGRAVLDSPILKRVVPAQTLLIYPNGWSSALGDTYHTRLNATAAELMIAAAHRSGDTATEELITGLLQREIADGFYDRNAQSGLEAFTMYVDKLKDVPPSTGHQDRTSWGKPLNILIQRNLARSLDYALAAGLYGTDGGHVHANGLAMELYGAGLILGPDLGRGTSYWQKDHGEYYSLPPAHNTVIINGRSNYPAHGTGHIPMKVELVEPAFGQPGVSPNISFAQGSFAYPKPASKQLRTLALIRTGPTMGFYVDVFRSKNEESTKGYHDYLYHGLGQSLALTGASGKALPLSSSTILTSKNGNLKGYDYFKDERSAAYDGDLHGTVSVDVGDKRPRAMDLWMLGNRGRTVFAVEGPAARASRGALPPKFMQIPMPTLLVRQKGNAWEQPFVSVFEPYYKADGASIKSVRPAKVEGNAACLAACVIEGRMSEKGEPAFSVAVFQDANTDQSRRVENMTFQGSFGAVLSRGDAIEEFYLGDGKALVTAEGSLTAAGEAPFSASLIRTSNGWRYSSTDEVQAALIYPTPEGVTSVDGWKLFASQGEVRKPIEGATLNLRSDPSGKKIIAATCLLPPGYDQQLIIASGSANKKPDFTQVKEKIQQWIDHGYYGGASLLVAKDGQAVFEEYFGNAKPESIVYIASAGKWLAAAAIAAVVDEGRLSWDDPVSKWIPELTGDKGKATLLQLLSHTAGYPAYQPKDKPVDTYQSLAESVKHIVPLPAEAEPGEVFKYGGLAMQVAGRMAELAANKDWETIFQEVIAKPLDMKDTHFTPVDDKAGGHAPMLGGGARSTLHDYANFLEMISNDGEFRGKRVLSKQAIHEMQADQVRGAKVEPGKEFVEKARGAKHNGIYGLGEWREELNDKGEVVLISSPSWAGAYPWIDKTEGVYGIFLTHVDVGGPANKDKFSAFYSSPVLPMLVREAIQKGSNQ